MMDLLVMPVKDSPLVMMDIDTKVVTVSIIIVNLIVLKDSKMSEANVNSKMKIVNQSVLQDMNKELKMENWSVKVNVLNIVQKAIIGIQLNRNVWNHGNHVQKNTLNLEINLKENVNNVKLMNSIMMVERNIRNIVFTKDTILIMNKNKSWKVVKKQTQSENVNTPIKSLNVRKQK